MNRRMLRAACAARRLRQGRDPAAAAAGTVDLSASLSGAVAQHPRRHPAGDRRPLPCLRILRAVRTGRHARHRAARCQSQDPTITGIAGEAMGQVDEIDPLAVGQRLHVVLSGRGAEIRASTPTTAARRIYSVFNLVKDEASIFGYGMPAIIRDPQVGAERRFPRDDGQCRRVVRAADRSSTCRTSSPKMATIGSSRENLEGQERHPERKSAVPVVPHRDAGRRNSPTSSRCATSSSTPCRRCRRSSRARRARSARRIRQQTALGMALLHNSANTVFRSIVKNFDDDVTTPDIRRVLRLEHAVQREAGDQGRLRGRRARQLRCC